MTDTERADDGGEATAQAERNPLDVEGEVRALKKAGEHVRAAELLLRVGHFEEAGLLFEEIFELERAYEAFLQAQSTTHGLRIAMRLDNDVYVDHLLACALEQGSAESLLRALQSDGRHAEIGRIHFARGELALASTAFEAGQHWARAATCELQLGDFRRAGLFFEKHLEQEPQDANACFQLGRILARFSRYEDAIAMMQKAIAHADKIDQMECRSAPVRILCFLRMGYEAAAQAIFERWNRFAIFTGDAVPGSLEAFLQSDRATALVALEESGESYGAPSEGATLAPLVSAEEKSPASMQEDAALLSGRYLLGEPLGGGGVGQVFRAYDAFADRAVAVKIFSAQTLSSKAFHAFARDVQAAASLSHPAITPLVELNTAQGYVVTELVVGEALEQKLQAGGSARWLLPWAQQLLQGLAVVHRVGLVHGALKPNNVFYLPGGVRLVDFGAHHLLTLRSTETGGLASVWPYLSPEQLVGMHPTAVSDLYALAAILYRACTGRAPFTSAEADRTQLPAPPSEIQPSMGAEWDAFFERALAPDPNLRFQNANEMRTALAQLDDTFRLPGADAMDESTSESVVPEETHRYRKGALVFRDSDFARVYEGEDLTVARSVWLVDVENTAALAALRFCASLARGVQPVYDILPDARRAVIARDSKQRSVDWAALRALPQSLARDCAALASALEAMHDAGFMLGGFSSDRCRGPIGPRIRLAPAELPRPLTAAGAALDWQDFAEFLRHAFDLPTGDNQTCRKDLLHKLVESRFLDAIEAERLQTEEESSPWSRFLDVLCTQLLAGASGRVMARLARRLLHDEPQPRTQGGL